MEGVTYRGVADKITKNMQVGSFIFDNMIELQLKNHTKSLQGTVELQIIWPIRCSSTIKIK